VNSLGTGLKIPLTTSQICFKKFISRLVQQGHSIEKLTPLFQQAASNLVFKHQQPNAASEDKTLFIQWVYNPKDIHYKELCALYNTILQPHVSFDKMVITLSRPKNLRDLLICSRLTLPNNLNLRDTVDQLKQLLLCKEQANQP
jgi:hypothetical protein